MPVARLWDRQPANEGGPDARCMKDLVRRRSRVETPRRPEGNGRAHVRWLLSSVLSVQVLAQQSPPLPGAELVHDLRQVLTPCSQTDPRAALPGLERFLDKYRGQDLAPLDYAPAVYQFLHGDCEAAVRRLDSYFTRYARLPVPEHNQLVGQVYVSALREAAAQNQFDAARVQALALRALDLRQPPQLVGDSVHRVLQQCGSEADVARVRVTLVRRLLADEQLSDGLRDDALGSLYGKPASADQPSTVPQSIEARAIALSGQIIDLRALRGRVILLHCWASWCPISAAEAPGLAGAYARFHTQGLEMVGIAVDGSTDDEVRERARALGFTWAQVQEKDFDGALVQRLAIDALPGALLLDRRGMAHARGDDARGVALEQRLATLFAN